MRSLILMAALLLSGCASVVTSKVTTFNEWANAPGGKTYVWDLPSKEEPSLEWKSYQNAVRNELSHLGMDEARNGAAPALRVSLGVSIFDQVYQMVYDPFFYPGRLGYWHPFWPGYRHWGWPYRGGYMFPDDTIHHLYKREVHVAIMQAADGKRLWEATVRNEDSDADNLQLVPIMVHAAFDGFPGPNGMTRDVSIEQK